MAVTSSIYIPIEKDYGLIEVEYNSTTIASSEVSFLRIKNALNGTINYCSYNPLNYKSAFDKTGNTLDVTSLQISETEWVHFDLDREISYFERQNLNILFQSVYHDMGNLSFDINYNTLKFHILSGYTFNDIAGLITRIAYTDRDGGNTFVANVAYLKEDSINFNSNPLKIGDKVYDRYIEIKFPTIQSLHTLNGYLSENIKKYDSNFSSFPSLSESKLSIFVYEVDNYEVDNRSGQLILNSVLPLGNSVSGIFRRDIEVSDIYSSISATIQESAFGDYFELFPSYEGDFLEDYLAQRQSIFNEEYVIIHSIDLYEAVYSASGYSETRTHSFTQIQEDNFDKPFKFRPVIENDNAVAFTIEYTVRLYDKNNPSNIIRRSSYTSKDTKKYGRWMEKIDLNTNFHPIKIVNKIVTETKKPLLEINPSLLSSGMSNNTTNNSNSVTYVPIQFSDIVTNIETLYVDSTSNDIIDISKSTNYDKVNKSNIIYGQGDGFVFLNDFDNFVKFKLYKFSNSSLVNLTDIIESDNTKIYLVFETDKGDKIKVSPLSKNTDSLNYTIVPGEFIFKINSSDTSLILKSNNNRFWITVENKSSGNVYSTNAVNQKLNFEVVLYTGYWVKMEDYNSLTTSDYTIKSRLLQNKYEDILNAQKSLQLLESDLLSIKNNINTSNMNEEQKALYDKVISQLDEIIQSAKIV